MTALGLLFLCAAPRPPQAVHLWHFVSPRSTVHSVLMLVHLLALRSLDVSLVRWRPSSCRPPAARAFGVLASISAGGGVLGAIVGTQLPSVLAFPPPPRPRPPSVLLGLLVRLQPPPLPGLKYHLGEWARRKRSPLAINWRFEGGIQGVVVAALGFCSDKSASLLWHTARRAPLKNRGIGFVTREKSALLKLDSADG